MSAFADIGNNLLCCFIALPRSETVFHQTVHAFICQFLLVLREGGSLRLAVFHQRGGYQSQQPDLFVLVELSYFLPIGCILWGDWVRNLHDSVVLFLQR
jgi:hypothetical protein